MLTRSFMVAVVRDALTLRCRDATECHLGHELTEIRTSHRRPSRRHAPGDDRPDTLHTATPTERFRVRDAHSARLKCCHPLLARGT